MLNHSKYRNAYSVDFIYFCYLHFDYLFNIFFCWRATQQVRPVSVSVRRQSSLGANTYQFVPPPHK